MANNSRFWTSLLQFVLRLLSSSGAKQNQPRPSQSRPSATLDPQRESSAHRPRSGGGAEAPASPGQFGDSRTIEVTPPARGALTISYNPVADTNPDAGEVVWTWVPYQENDGRGKDRPVLVIGKHGANRVYVVRLTSKPHDGDRDFLSIGTGAWDSQGRESWVDIEQVYSVHQEGMRREAAPLDVKRFSRVAEALVKRYGWKVAGA